MDSMPCVHSERQDDRVKPCARQMPRRRVSNSVGSVQYVFEHTACFQQLISIAIQRQPIFLVQRERLIRTAVRSSCCGVPWAKFSTES